MLESLVQWDRDAMVLLNMGESHTSFWDSFFWMVSDILVWLPMMLLFFYVVVKNKRLSGSKPISTLNPCSVR